MKNCVLCWVFVVCLNFFVVGVLSVVMLNVMMIVGVLVGLLDDFG